MPRFRLPTPRLLTSGLKPEYLVDVNRFCPVTYALAPFRLRVAAPSHRVGRACESVAVRRRRYEPFSRTQSVRSVPTDTGEEPRRGSLPFGFVGDQAL